jgi:hypothetical protein
MKLWRRRLCIFTSVVWRRMDEQTRRTDVRTAWAVAKCLDGL